MHSFFTVSFIYIPITDPAPLLSALPLQLSSITSQRRGSPFGHHPTLGHLVPAGLSTSSPTESQPGRGRGSNGREQSQRQHLLHLLGTHMKTKLHTCICVGGLGPVHACSLIDYSAIGSPQRPNVVDSVCLPVGFPSPLSPLVLPSTLP